MVQSEIFILSTFDCQFSDMNDFVEPNLFDPVKNGVFSTLTFQICIECRCIKVRHESTRVDSKAPLVDEL